MRQLLILFLLLLTGCGFHLRGAVQLPSELSELTLVDARPATDIAPALRRALQGQGVRLMEGAPLQLQLQAENYGKRVLSVDAAGRAQEYGLSYGVRFGLRAADGVVWLPEETLTRDLRFDATAVLSTSTEEARLKDDMRRDAVLQILRRLQYAKPPQQKQEMP
jgi:LPS-assembly lipoprotein